MKTTHFLTCFAILSTLWICSCSSDPEIIEPEGPPAPFINQQDMEALRAIYKEGGGEYWDVPWDLSDSTKWSIQYRLVDPETNEYRVTNLYIACNQEKPVGTLSKEIAKLTELDVFYINGKGIGGEIPDSLTQLKKLRDISFYNTSFYGKIPEGLLSLPKLELLRIENTNLSGELPKDMTNTSKTVFSICLKNNNFNGKIPGNLKIRSLDLEYNNFTEYPYEYIPVSKKMDSNGPVIHLRYNKINGTIPDSILNCPHAMYNIDLLLHPQKEGYGPSNYPKENF